MKPKKDYKRYAFKGGPLISKASIKDDSQIFDENGDLSFVEDEAPDQEDIDIAEMEFKKMSDEDIKIKALKQATDIAKLMADITVDDIINIAKKVAKYIKG